MCHLLEAHMWPHNHRNHRMPHTRKTQCRAGEHTVQPAAFRAALTAEGNPVVGTHHLKESSAANSLSRLPDHPRRSCVM